MTVNSSVPIYLDYAATTPVSAKIYAAMEPYFCQRFGNPSSLYELGSEARSAVETAREQVAAALSAKPREVTFTAGGTEANNLAMKGVALRNQERGRHIIISAIEHSSVLNCAEQLSGMGWDVTLLPVSRAGAVAPADLAAAIKPATVLVSIAMVNNEIGTLQDIPALSAVTAERAERYGHKIYFHTDAIQALGKLPLNVGELGVDLMTLSGHKVHAPKGIGALYARRGTQLEPLIVGGGQEQARRSGTENVPYIVAMGAAVQFANDTQAESASHYAALSRHFTERLRASHPEVVFNSGAQSVPSIINVSFPRIAGETLLIALDFAGVSAASGSACSSASVEPSHVLTAIGLDADRATNSIRFSFGRATTIAEIDQFMERLASVLTQLAEYG